MLNVGNIKSLKNPPNESFINKNSRVASSMRVSECVRESVCVCERESIELARLCAAVGATVKISSNIERESIQEGRIGCTKQVLVLGNSHTGSVFRGPSNV